MTSALVVADLVIQDLETDEPTGTSRGDDRRGACPVASSSNTNNQPGGLQRGGAGFLIPERLACFPHRALSLLQSPFGLCQAIGRGVNVAEVMSRRPVGRRQVR